MAPRQVAPDPSKVRRAGIGLIERLEVDHLLIGLRRICHAPLLHQHVAEKAEVEDKLTQADKAPGDCLSFAKAMHLVEHVPTQQ